MVTKTIKPGGTPGVDCDYTSLDAFELDAGGLPNKDLVSQGVALVAEVYGGGNCLAAALTFSGWTTNNTFYITIQAAASARHAGVWDTSKAYGSLGDSNAVITNSGACLHLKGMQFAKTAGGNCVYYATASAYVDVIDQCIMKHAQGLVVLAWSGKNITIYSSILILSGVSGYCFANSDSNGLIYNSTIISGDTGLITGAPGQVITSQNNYISAPTCYYPTGGGTINKGSNDATSNTEALTPALRSIPYSTANFVDVTPGAENLHLVVGSVLRDVGVTTPAVIDIDGRMRIAPFDIGADEYLDAPICWNYTARYKNSNKLFKASGCGSFPRTLRVPSNVDISTGRMIDDGILINPDEYEAV